jgi:hypothetical protein
MPNWCYNKVKVTFEPENEQTLRDAIEKEGEEFFNLLVPRPEEKEEDWYEWNISSWGTKWDAKPYDVEWEDGAVRFNLDTAWGPPLGFYDALCSMGYSVEAYYLEEGMAFVGYWEDGYDDAYNYGDMTADEMEEELPQWVEVEWNLISQQRDREDEEEEFEDEEEVTGYEYSDDEMTDWFDVKTKPVHIGEYDVQYDKPNAWPFPSRLTWTGKKWINGQGEQRKDVGKWRGLNFDPVQKEEDLQKALEELKKEFDELMANE